MKLPKLEKSEKYVGLYVVDFGDHSSTGFTAEEVAEILDSERYKDVKVYKIHRAYPDGRMELKGVPNDTFQLESGMFFYADNIVTAEKEYKELLNLAIKTAPPCRAKVQLAKLDEQQFITAIIYPAEYDDLISRWLLDGNYKTARQAEGGINTVTRFYNLKAEILKSQQLFTNNEFVNRTGHELLANLRAAVQR